MSNFLEAVTTLQLYSISLFSCAARHDVNLFRNKHEEIAVQFYVVCISLFDGPFHHQQLQDAGKLGV